MVNKKYDVRACLNCEYCSIDKKTKVHSCTEGNEETLYDWLSTSGRKRLTDMTPDDDLECFSPNKRFRETEKNKEKLSDFMADLNAMLEN